MIRIFLIAILLVATVTLQAQPPAPYSLTNHMHPGFRQFNQRIDTSLLHKKWFITKYLGLSAGFTAFNRSHNSFLSVPASVQINRQLTSNVLAFANVSLSPTYFPYSSGFYSSAANKHNTFMNPNHFGTYSAAHMGLMYINNDKTFSVSGSFGIGRNNYFGASPFYNPAPAPGIRNRKQ